MTPTKSRSRVGDLDMATMRNRGLAGQTSPRPSAACWLIETGVSVNSITLSASKTCYNWLAGPA